jgi:hypothetical protein
LHISAATKKSNIATNLEDSATARSAGHVHSKRWLSSAPDALSDGSACLYTRWLRPTRAGLEERHTYTENNFQFLKSKTLGHS